MDFMFRLRRILCLSTCCNNGASTQNINDKTPLSSKLSSTSTIQEPKPLTFF